MFVCASERRVTYFNTIGKEEESEVRPFAGELLRQFGQVELLQIVAVCGEQFGLGKRRSRDERSVSSGDLPGSSRCC